MLPLLNRRVLVTRSRHQASQLAAILESLGALPILIPTIEIAPPGCFESLDAAIAGLGTFDWLVFTSANAVEAFAARTRTLDPYRVPSAGAHKAVVHKTAAIGPSTARAAEEIGLTVDLVPPRAVAESLSEALLPRLGPNARVLLVRAEKARDHLETALLAAGAEVTIAPAYRTIVPGGSITALQSLFSSPPHYPDAITFTSSSTAGNLFALLDAAGLTLPRDIPRASIGPITTRTLRDLGLPPHLEAHEATIQSLADGLAGYFRNLG